MGYRRKQQDKSRKDDRWHDWKNALKRTSSGPHTNSKDKRKSNKRKLEEDY